MISSCVKEKQRETWKFISISLLHLMMFPLFLAWITGCGSNLQAPISNTRARLNVADFNTVLEIVDVSEPTKPIRVSSIYLPSKPEYYSSITVWKQFVLATTAYGVHLLDVTNPAAPTLLWNLPLETVSGKAVVYDDYAFFPTRNGLYVLHLKNPLEPQWVYHAEHEGNVRSHLIDLKTNGHYAYTHDVHKYLHVFNVSQPQQPELVNSYAVDFPSSLLLLRGLGEEAELIHQTSEINLLSLADPTRLLHLRQHDLPLDFSSQLADWNNLLELNTNWVVKTQMSSQYLCWLYLRDDSLQLWFLPSDGNRVYAVDVAPEYIRCQYNSGVKRPPKPGHVTDVITERGEFYLISRDNWMEKVRIDPNEGGRITDFQLSANLVYILMEHGGLFIAELSPANTFLRGLGLLENLSQTSQCLTVDKNILYILGTKKICAPHAAGLESRH